MHLKHLKLGTIINIWIKRPEVSGRALRAGCFIRDNGVGLLQVADCSTRNLFKLYDKTESTFEYINA